MSGPALSVIVASYNRAAQGAELLRELAAQTLPPDRFEVIVVDDGSQVPAEPALRAVEVPFALTVVTQANAGPAAARHAGIERARGEIVVILDDDMRIQPTFLAEHLAAHPPGSRRVVLGRLLTVDDGHLPLFERMHMQLLDKLAAEVASGAKVPNGADLYTGNVSMRRADYLGVGGFDRAFRLSEDAELGIRLEQSGVEFGLSEAASSLHASDHTSIDAWVRRSIAYGGADTRVAAKHPTLRRADPWRFLFMVNPVSRVLLYLSAFRPALMRPVAWLALRVSLLFDRLGVNGAASAGATLVYGMHYFMGVREHAGSRAATRAGLDHYLNGCHGRELGVFAQLRKLFADVRADHQAIVDGDVKYRGGARSTSVLADLVQKIGFQMMVAYRVMRFFRTARLGLFAKLSSRAIRHLYGADIHWDAELAPGVILIHGVGLVVSHAARVGPRCILFQHVTLGESIHPETRAVGSPLLEADVHVGPGAVLLGPITIGQGSKVMASAVVMYSVPERSLVEVPMPVVRSRAAVARGGPSLTLSRPGEQAAER